MIIIDLKNKGRRLRLNPLQDRREMDEVLARYMGTGKSITGENKKTSGSATHGTMGSNKKLDKSRAHRSVSYLTKGLAITSANYLSRWVRNQNKEQEYSGTSPQKLGLTADEIAALRDDKGVCAGATPGCIAVCLVNAGQQGTPMAKTKQIRRHLAYKFARDALMSSVAIEIVNLIKSVQRLRGKRNHKGQVYPAVRLNINSDISWEEITFHVDPWLAKIVQSVSIGTVPTGTLTLMDLFARTEAIFYDYTKQSDRFRRYATAANWPSNYFLCFSMSESRKNRETALWYINQVQNGSSVRPAQIAVPFVRYDAQGNRLIRLPGKKGVQWPLPSLLTITHRATGASATAQVLDADPSDARFDDAMAAPGSIAGLRFKEVLAKSKKGTVESYNRLHVQPSINMGFLLPACEGSSHVVVDVNSGGKVITADTWVEATSPQRVDPHVA